MSQPYDDNRYNATILHHVDGDTTHIMVHLPFDEDRRMVVRWYGVNAPEIATQEGKDALAWVASQMPEGAVVLFQSFKDKREKYGRYLGTFFVNGENLNQKLIDNGHAVAYFG